MTTFIVLITAVNLFLPGWSKDNPQEKMILVSRNVIQYESMTQCQSAMKAVEDIHGVYTKSYPYKDSSLHLSLYQSCQRVSEEELSKLGKSSERSL